jgi:hypothetical protein
LRIVDNASGKRSRIADHAMSEPGTAHQKTRAEPLKTHSLKLDTSRNRFRAMIIAAPHPTFGLDPQRGVVTA